MKYCIVNIIDSFCKKMTKVGYVQCPLMGVFSFLLYPVFIVLTNADYQSASGGSACNDGNMEPSMELRRDGGFWDVVRRDYWDTADA